MYKSTTRIFFLFFVLYSPLSSSQSITTTPGPQLSVERVGHETQGLSNGKILIMGGDNGYLGAMEYHRSCQVYNPSANAMESAAPMLVPRSGFMSAVLNNGHILAIGGNNNSAFGIKSCEEYDPATNQWSFVDSLKESHWRGAAIRLNDGRILVAGGYTTRSELYDPNTNKWSFSGDMSVQHGTGMSLTMLSNGDVLAVGGESNPKAMEVFSVQNNAWTKSSYSTSGNRQDHLAILLPNGNVLLAGSSYFSTADQTSAEIYYTSYGYTSTTGKLLTNLSAAKGVILENGRILTFGIGDIFTIGNTKIFQEYNTSTGTWSSGAFSSIGASDYTMDVLPNGNIFIAGGNFTTGNGANPGTIIVKQTGVASCVAPSLDVKLSVSSSACYGKNPSIKVESTEADVTYRFFVSGTEIAAVSGSAQPIDMEVDGSRFHVGANLVTVKAVKSGCPAMLGKNTLVLQAGLANTTKTNISIKSGSALLCSSTSKAVFAVDPPLSTTYKWNNNTTGNELEVNYSAAVWARNVDANGCYGLPSDMVVVRKISSSDVKAGDYLTLCETAGAVQLEGTPKGGTWSGTGVTSSGLFTPTVAKAGSHYLTYSFCDYTSSKSIYLESTNTIDYLGTNITWPKDTLCGGVNYSIQLGNFNSNYRYRLYADGQLLSTSSGSSFYPSFKPSSETKAVLTFKIDKAYPSTTCPKDSLSLSKNVLVYPAPPAASIVIADTACYQWGVPIKITNPLKGAYYYASFYPDRVENHGVKVKAQNTNNLTVYSRPLHWESSKMSITVYAIPSLSCSTATVYLGSKDVQPIVQVTTVGLGSVYYTGENVAPVTTSNSDSYQWTIDGVAYTTKNAPEKTYNSVGKHKYTLYATSKYGCIDTVSKEISIIKKFPVSTSTTCLFDTNLIHTQQTTLFKSIVDKKGNSIYIGSRWMDYAGNYSGSDNGIIEKYSKSGGKAIWRLAHSPYYASSSDFYSMYITGVTVDDNNDIYITGGYTARNLQFAGVTINHTEGSYPYGHAYIAKISEAGKLLWFIYSHNISYSDRSTYETGGSDIQYANGKLYVSARVLYQKNWKNQAGIAVPVENPDLMTEYAIMEVDPNGSKVKALAPIGTSYGYGSTLMGLKTLNSSGYYTAKIPILAPLIKVFPNGKLAVYGMLRQTTEFGSKSISASLSSSEFTGIINPAQTGWESVTVEGSTDALPVIQLDKHLPVAVYTPAMNKISALNTEEYYASYPMTYTIQLPSEAIQTKGKAALIKKIDKKGNLLWKRLLNGAYIQNLHISSDSSQVIAVGSFINGMSIEYGESEYGMNNSLTRDLFAMGFSTANGSILWAEKLGSKSYDDYYYVSAMSSCNDLLLMGYRNLIYLYSTRDTVWHEQQSLSYISQYPYLLRIPLTGMCDAQNCRLLTSTHEQEISDMQGNVVFPNPTNSTFTVRSRNGDEITGVALRNLEGNVVLSFSSLTEENAKLNVSGLPSGIYFLEIQTSIGTSVHKVSIIK